MMLLIKSDLAVIWLQGGMGAALLTQPDNVRKVRQE